MEDLGDFIMAEATISVNNFSLWNTLWQFNIAIENGSLTVDLPIPNGDFP